MATIYIPEVDNRDVEIKRFEVPFNGTVSGLLTNKSRFPLLNLSSTVDVIDVRVRLTALTSTTASQYSFQVVAFPQGSYTDGAWKALTAELTSKTSWAASQTLGIAPDAIAELVAASPRLGASAGFGVGTASTGASGGIIPLPLAKGFDLLTVGFDIGGGNINDALTLRGSLIITCAVPAAKKAVLDNRVGGIGLQVSLANGVKRGTSDALTDGAGYVLASTDNSTAVGASV